MSKDIMSLDPKGELVGISKISYEAFERMHAFSKMSYEKGNKEIHYEDALVGISGERNISVKVVNGLAWCEIDDEDHLTRAINIVYPEIQRRENLP
jgi:2-aminoethylphosphonate-pyruvate transaminase